MGQDERYGSPFQLETGGEELAVWFDEVDVRRNDGKLTVTEAGPLVDYVQSTTRTRLEHDEVTVFRRNLEDRLSAHGVIRITTAAGMFVARKNETR